jgi:hypothetical protein
MRGKRLCLAILSPLIFTADLVLLLRSEVVCDIESLTNLLRRLSLDHVGNGFAANIKEWLNIEVIGGLIVKLDGGIPKDGQTMRTRMISNNISWSTCINFWSHSSISVVFFRESESSSAVAGGSFLWCSHHSITFLRTDSFTCVGLMSACAV